MRRHRALWFSLCCALALGACGDDDKGLTELGDLDSGAADSGRTPQTDSGALDSGNGPQDSGSGDAAAEDDGGNTDAGTDVVEYIVPAGGGTIMLPAGDVMVSFKFPASAAGKDISLQLVDPADVDFPDDSLADTMAFVIDMQPDGTVFTDPVEVTFSDGSVIAFSIDAEGKFTPLALAASGDALLVTHFSYLAVPAAAQLCESSSGWTDDADSQRCSAAGSATSYRHFTCKNYRFCYILDAGCCVDPATNADPGSGCLISDPELYVGYKRTDSNGGQYPYCDEGLPTLTSIAASLEATGVDQVITLTGTSFDPNGSVFIDGDVLVATTWMSATQASAVVPGSRLTAAGMIMNIGYYNPTYNAAGACTLAASSNCDRDNASNRLAATIVVDTSLPTCLTGGSPVAGSGQGTCEAPLVVNLRNGVAGDIYHHTPAQGTGEDQSTLPSSEQCGLTATARDVVYHVLLPAGADLEVSVDGVDGSDPAIFMHEDDACNAPINACANDHGGGACEIASATHGSGALYDADVFVTVAEGVSSSATYTTRFRLTGAVTMPTLASLTPSSANEDSSTMITVTLNDGSYWDAYAIIRDGSTVLAMPFCDPTSVNTCDFSLPSTLSPGTYDVTLRFDGRPGTPETSNSLQLTVNAPTSIPTPTVSSITASLIANGQAQTITLTGTGFHEGGSVFVDGDVAVATTWHSATSATATIPGDLLQSAGTLGDVGFVNPTAAATGACTAQAVSNCDFQNRSSDLRDLTVDEALACMAAGVPATDVAGVGSCGSPLVIDLRNAVLGDVYHHSVLAGTGNDEGDVPAAGTPECGVASTARDIVYHVLLPAGADFDVSVDAMNGSNPVVFVHESDSCFEINGCADSAGADACEIFAAKRNTHYYGSSPYVSVSEAVSSGLALTTRFRLTGSITAPTLLSLTPNSAAVESGQNITATLQNGSGWNADVLFRDGDTLVETGFCDPTGNDTCVVSLPNALPPGTYSVNLQFNDRPGMPDTNPLSFVVTAFIPTPNVTSIDHTLAIGGGDQVITLHGTGFDPNGSALYSGNIPLATTWISETQVTATVLGSQLVSSMLANVGYVSPTANATGACTPEAPANCDFNGKRHLFGNLPVQTP